MVHSVFHPSELSFCQEHKSCPEMSDWETCASLWVWRLCPIKQQSTCQGTERRATVLLFVASKRSFSKIKKNQDRLNESIVSNEFNCRREAEMAILLHSRGHLLPGLWEEGEKVRPDATSEDGRKGHQNK